MSDNLSKHTDFLLSRRGITYLRWRAVRAFLLSKPACLTHDPEIAPVLNLLDEATASHLAQEFRDAYLEAHLHARELATDRNPYPSDYQKAPKQEQPITQSTSAGPRTDASHTSLRRIFKWRGQIAFAKGIDRSPTHDRYVARSLHKHSNDCALELIRAWEAGWDDAFDYGSQLKIERMSVLEIPRVIDARSIPKKHGTSKKD